MPGGLWLLVTAIVVAAVAGGFLFLRASRADKPSEQATERPVAAARPVPKDVCAFIGETALRKYLPDANFNSKPGRLETASHRQSVCETTSQDGRAQIVVRINRYSASDDGTSAAENARSSFGAYCRVFSGAWSAGRPSAPPTPAVGQAVCGDAPGAVLLLVLQGETVVDLTFKGQTALDQTALTDQTADLAEYVFSRVDTLR